jgi:hypothetical protein
LFVRVNRTEQEERLVQAYGGLIGLGVFTQIASAVLAGQLPVFGFDLRMFAREVAQ